MIGGLMVDRGDLVELRIESAAYEGTSVGRLDRLVVFVPFGVPGDLAKVRIVRKRRRYLEGTIEELLEPSRHRTEPRCRHFGVCGGCRLQNMAYEEQLQIKQREVSALLERIGHLDGIEVLPTLPCPDPYFYRNKMEFSFGPKRWLTREEVESGREVARDFAAGLHIPKRYDRILDIQECYLQSEQTVPILECVRRLALARGWEPYDSREHQGFLRNLVIRVGQGTGEVMVALVTTRHDPACLRLVTEELLQSVPEVTTILNIVNSTRSPVASGDEGVVLGHGPGFIWEQLGHLRFRIAPGAFFQPNTKQAERLFGVIRELSDLEPDKNVYDLFCGMGAIGLFLSDQAERVVGVESWPESVDLARENARINGIENCAFFSGDAGEAFSSDFLQREGTPDVVILDPPRAGLPRGMVKRLMRHRPPRIVYTSCNPATQARDLGLLSEVYSVDMVQPVDMFPQTYHIEAVARLTRLGR
jgi:23S rRNA (uracil1939-C5)-methyltransferase